MDSVGNETNKKITIFARKQKIYQCHPNDSLIVINFFISEYNWERYLRLNNYFQVRQLMSNINQPTIKSICIADSAGSDSREVVEVKARAGRGLEGDRYFSSDAPDRTQLTLIESDAIQELNKALSINLPFTAFRRNLVSQGVRLNPLVGSRFLIDDVEIEAIELCEPCAELQNILGLPGFVKNLVHKGGLRCRIISNGVIKKGSVIRTI